jgi:CheY-like chemotaxis protein
MTNISILIVDDDINKIAAIISAISQSTDQVLVVKQASNVQEAIDWLSRYEFHLLITDLLMPLKYDGAPDPKGGESLIRNMYRRRSKLRIPMYIVGLTQFANLQPTFEGVWKVWTFDIASDEWKKRLRDLIFHIGLVHSRILNEKVETVFVEGPSDHDLLLQALRDFHPEYVGKLRIETRAFGGGASWVERQLVIWAKSLTNKIGSNEYLKSIGLFDDDEAGKKAIDRLLSTIKIHSAESKTFSILKCNYKFSPLLKSIKNKGLMFATSIEEMIDIEVWQKAKVKGWLVPRNFQSYLIAPELLPLTSECVSEENLSRYCFSADEQLISLFKVNETYKDDFIKAAMAPCLDDRKRILQNIGFIIKEMLLRLKVDD